MLWILARQQSFAEEAFGALQASAFDEVPVMRDENVFDEMRIADEEDLLAAHAVGHDVAVGPRQTGEERQRITAARPVYQLLEGGELRTRRKTRGNRRLRHRQIFSHRRERHD